MERAPFCVRLLRRNNWAATITTATTSAADCASVSEKSLRQPLWRNDLTKANRSRNHHIKRIFMKRFIPTIAILLPLFFFAGCGPSKNPEANAPAASPAASAARITASPNPVTTGEGHGTTTVTWWCHPAEHKLGCSAVTVFQVTVVKYRVLRCGYRIRRCRNPCGGCRRTSSRRICLGVFRWPASSEEE